MKGVFDLPKDLWSIILKKYKTWIPMRNTCRYFRDLITPKFCILILFRLNIYEKSKYLKFKPIRYFVFSATGFNLKWTDPNIEKKRIKNIISIQSLQL